MTTPPPETAAARIGRLLRESRQAAKLSQEQLGELAGLSRPHLSRIESGLTDPAASTLEKLEAALHLRPGSLMSGESVEIASGAA